MPIFKLSWAPGPRNCPLNKLELIDSTDRDCYIQYVEIESWMPSETQGQ